MIVPVVLCGGSGTRLWPLSRKLSPKQFLPLVSEHSLLQDTLKRLDGAPRVGPPVLVGSHEHRFALRRQLAEIGVRSRSIVTEPVARGTAAAVAAAAMLVAAEDPDAVLLVLPSDHALADAEGFHQRLEHAASVALAGHLVTFGVTPTNPETGYGYIEPGDSLTQATGAFRIRQFLEKPSAGNARELLAGGRHLWNSGMFVFTARRIIDELRRFRPDIVAATELAVGRANRAGELVQLDASAFAAVPAESIDRAVMERTELGAVLRIDLGWNDVGSWAALWDVGPSNPAGNVTRGDVAVHEATNCYVRSESRHVAVVGVDNLVVVETADAVLVTTRERSQDVRHVVAKLERDDRGEHIAHARIERPWGSFETLDLGTNHRVKRIVVEPGQALSLQLHRRRCEHWLVVDGGARVTIGDAIRDLRTGDTCFIPVGERHRLENIGHTLLVLIEIQLGTYLGEDDIERLDDRYGR